MRQLAGVMLAILTGWLAAHQVSGAIAYLPGAGPAPLRIEPATDPDAPLPWKPLRPVQPLATNVSVPVPLAAASTNATNDVVLKASSSSTTNVFSLVSVPVAAMADWSEQTNSETSSPLMIWPFQSEDDSNPVTPQLLAGFFKPVRAGEKTDGTVLLTPKPVDFVPPTPKTNIVSRAIYKTQ
jgi:hypothetical protein